MDLFQTATKSKYRYKSDRGSITTEDLWSLQIPELKSIALSINKELKAGKDDDDIFNDAASPIKAAADAVLTNKIEIIKLIVSSKQEDVDKRAKAADKRTKQQHLLTLLAQKRDEQLGAKSIEELEKELLALDAE